MTTKRTESLLESFTKRYTSEKPMTVDLVKTMIRKFGNFMEDNDISIVYSEVENRVNRLEEGEGFGTSDLSILSEDVRWSLNILAN